MTERNKFIFDMDGTLYQFDKKKGQEFTNSRFGNDIQQNVHSFFARKFGLSPEEAITEHKRVSNKFNGEVSLGLESDFGIDRAEYFAATWNLDPSAYIDKNPNLRDLIMQLHGRIALLTAAPRIWAVRVLAHLNVEDVFGYNVFTGDPDERKPNVVVFQNIANIFDSPTNQIFSIGDQEQTDILPAKSIGMKTLKIGSSVTSADYHADDIELAISLLKSKGHI